MKSFVCPHPFRVRSRRTGAESLHRLQQTKCLPLSQTGCCLLWQCDPRGAERTDLRTTRSRRRAHRRAPAPYSGQVLSPDRAHTTSRQAVRPPQPFRLASVSETAPSLLCHDGNDPRKFSGTPATLHNLPVLRRTLAASPKPLFLGSPALSRSPDGLVRVVQCISCDSPSH